MCKRVELRISLGLQSVALAIGISRESSSVSHELSISSIHPLQRHLTEKIGPTLIILVSDSQVYSVRSFHPFSLSDFIPIQKKPTKILVLDIAIALDQPNLHLLVAVCVGLCVPCFSVFSFECLGLGF